MSGFETSGLILGAIPLLITAVEQGNKAFYLAKLKASSHEIGYILEELERQQVLLQQSLRVLLRDSLRPVDLDELLWNPQNPRWRDATIELALRRSLREDDIYQHLVELFSQVFENISALEKSLLPFISGQKNVFDSWSLRVKWALSSTRTRERVQLMKRQSDLIANLISLSSIKLEDFKQWQTAEHVGISSAELLASQQVDDDVYISGDQESLALSERGKDIDNYSVMTDLEHEDTTLPYLPLSVQSVGSIKPGKTEEALLDTGANLCAISMTAAIEFGLKISEAEERFVRTSIVHNDLEIQGRVHVNLRWRDKDGKGCGAKRWLYVVYGLTQSIVLSNDFIDAHQEVWAVAKHIVNKAKSINYTFFFKRAKEQQAAEEDFRRRRAEENRKINEEESRARDAELDAVVGASISVSAAGASSSASTSTQP